MGCYSEHNSTGGPVMGRQGHSYLAYMVRFWKVQSGGPLVWRVSLEDPHTGERKSFASLESLLAFFKE
jgi:Rps23 Pro-64 3,4-dihydroxylase Tpa1-like proline 4-hydroxylase